MSKQHEVQDLHPKEFTGTQRTKRCSYWLVDGTVPDVARRFTLEPR